MHIGFDISQTGATKAGCGYFAHAMAAAMLEIAPGERFSLYPSFGDFYFDVNMPRSSPYPARGAEYGPRFDTIEQARSFWLAPDLEAKLGHPDVIQSNNFWCPPQLARTRLAYTLHDLSFVANPSWTTEINRAACWEGASRAASEADAIVAISRATQRHFLEVFPDFPEERVQVIYPCSRFTSGDARGRMPASAAALRTGGFWLSVGTIEPRKNQRHIASAYARYLERGGERIPLVFAGGAGWLMDDFRDHLRSLGVGNDVVLTGYVSDEELVWLYRNCRAHLYVSHFEGFGLPVLEGMQFGAPTIASNATSIPEVAGDAAVLVAPTDEDALVEALLRLSSDPGERGRLSEASLRQAARFSAHQSATQLMSLYRQVVAAPKRSAKTDVIPAGRWSSAAARLYERAIRSLRRP